MGNGVRNENRRRPAGELWKQRTVAETFRCVTPAHMETVSTWALCILGLLPLLCAAVDFYLNSRLMVLYRANSSIGYMGLLLGVFLLIWWRYRPEKPPFREWIRGKGLPAFLLLMLLWSVGSCVLSTNPALSYRGDWYRLDGLMSYLAYAGIFLFASRIRRDANWRAVLTFFSGTASVMALIGLLHIGKLCLFFGINAGSAIFFNVNHYGYYLCMALPAAVGLFVTERGRHGAKGRWLTILYGVEIALLTNALIRAHSLGPLLAVIGFFIGLTALCFRVSKPHMRRVFSALALFVAVALISSVNTWNIPGDVRRTAEDLGTVVDSAVGQDGSGGEADRAALDRVGSGRGQVWIIALRFVKERPLFGYGPDNLREAYAQAGSALDRPHCEPLQFAASLGIPAAVFYLCGLLCLLIGFIRKLRRLRIEVLCAFCIVGSYLISSLVGNTMFYTSPFFFMMLGLAYGLLQTVPGERSLR